MAQLLDVSGATYQRKISSGTYVFTDYITIEEDPSDQAVITRHPVDSGAIMSDHIFLMPPELRLKLGWSNANATVSADGSATASAVPNSSAGAPSSPTYVRDTYNNLLQLKNARQLFTVFTGKRIYYNMFVKELRGPLTDRRFEWSMVVDILLQQLLLVNLQSTGISPSPNTASANASQQNLANPSANQPTSNQGSAQTTSMYFPANSSAPTGAPSGGLLNNSTAVNALTPDTPPSTNSNDGGILNYPANSSAPSTAPSGGILNIVTP